MALEIERKFLVKGEYKSFATESHRIRQGYINGEGERTVRVRIRDDKAFLTIKGPSIDGGLSRFEWEKEIPFSDAEDLMKLCVSGIIDKTRHIIPFGGHTFEVDEFYGDNLGLTMAEVEIPSPDEAVDLPEWIGKEVTGDFHYYNSFLSRHPFTTW